MTNNSKDKNQQQQQPAQDSQSPSILQKDGNQTVGTTVAPSHLAGAKYDKADLRMSGADARLSEPAMGSSS